MLIHIETEMAKHKTNKENPCQPKRHALHAELAQRQTDGHYEREYHYRVGHSPTPESGKAPKEMFNDFHYLSTFRISGCKGMDFAERLKVMVLE